MLLPHFGSLIGAGLLLMSCVLAGGAPQEKTASAAVPALQETLNASESVQKVVPVPLGADSGTASTHYEVTLKVNLAQQVLEGEEEIHFEGRTGKIDWQTQDNVKIRSATAKGGELVRERGVCCSNVILSP
jgi:hypothetical protein